MNIHVWYEILYAGRLHVSEGNIELGQLHGILSKWLSQLFKQLVHRLASFEAGRLLTHRCLPVGFEAVHPFRASFKVFHSVPAGFEAVHPAPASFKAVLRAGFEVGQLPFVGHKSGQPVSKKAGQLRNGQSCESDPKTHTQHKYIFSLPFTAFKQDSSLVLNHVNCETDHLWMYSESDKEWILWINTVPMFHIPLAQKALQYILCVGIQDVFNSYKQ